MSGGARSALPPGRPVGRWASLASFALSTFYVALLFWLTVWVVVPALVLGWRPLVVTSGSMHPLIRTGDVVLVRDHDTDEALASGSVIAFRDVSRDGAVVTHRIAGQDDLGNYVTRGDANRVDDPTPVAPTAVVGVGRLLVPMIGLPLTWLPDTMPLFVGWLIVTILAIAVAARAPDPPDDDPEGDAAVPAAAPPVPAGAGAAHSGGRFAVFAAGLPPGGAIVEGRRRHRRARPVLRPRLVPVYVTIVVAAALVPTTAGAFTDTTANTGSRWAASVVAPPTALEVTACGNDKGSRFATLSWTAPSPAPAGFQLEQAPAAAGPYTVVATPAAPPHTVALANNTQYHFRVRSVDGSWTSVPSNVVGVIVAGNVCTVS